MKTYRPYRPGFAEWGLFLGLLASVLILSAVLAAPKAHAQTPSCYIGGSLTGQVATIKEDGFSEDNKGIGYGVLAGCQIGLGNLDAGGRIGYDWARHSDVNLGSWHAAGILGWRINEHIRPYAVAGVTGLDADINFTGIIAGAGLEITLAKNLAATVEYNRMWLDSKTIEEVKVNPSVDVIRLGIVYKLF